MDLSIVVPSIRADKIQRLYDSIPASIGDFSYEVIVIGPYQPPFECKYIEDLGSPSRCVQQGIAIAEGKFFTWGTDDGIYNPNALSEAISLLQTLTHKDGIIMKYTEEGPPSPLTGAHDHYYIARTHDSNRLMGIPENYMIAPVPMYNIKYFIDLGGLDCSFDHINMNTHDFAFRLQKDGGTFHFSPSVIMHCDSNQFGDDHKVLDEAYFLNDLPRFQEIYGGPFSMERVKIDYDNWKNAEAVWRRFK